MVVLRVQLQDPTRRLKSLQSEHMMCLYQTLDNPVRYLIWTQLLLYWQNARMMFLYLTSANPAPCLIRIQLLPSWRSVHTTFLSQPLAANHRIRYLTNLVRDTEVWYIRHLTIPPHLGLLLQLVH